MSVDEGIQEIGTRDEEVRGWKEKYGKGCRE